MLSLVQAEWNAVITKKKVWKKKGANIRTSKYSMSVFPVNIVSGPEFSKLLSINGGDSRHIIEVFRTL